MKVASKFTIAVHTMLVIAYFFDKAKVTSDFILGSVGVNSVIIRRILLDLKVGGLITVTAGAGGASISKEAKEITLLDIYKAVIGDGEDFFSFHSSPNPACPVGKRIHDVLDTHLEKSKLAFFKQLKGVTLKVLLDKI